MSHRQSDKANYVLGHSVDELNRLAVQGRLIEPITRAFFQGAGVAPGMRVLDVGCGAGDVSLLVAKLVGRTGAVVGVDRSSDAVEIARQRSAAAGP
jgi:ubiquinone/menaquinone biosynthesis C-methylase UbiE